MKPHPPPEKTNKLYIMTTIVTQLNGNNLIGKKILSSFIFILVKCMTLPYIDFHDVNTGKSLRQTSLA